ncbi:MAG: sigma-54 dependent transcriptional regulator [Planctomycetaceae bacterium]
MKNNPTILIVDDQLNEREALSRMLRQEGFLVVAATNADQATGYFEEPIDLVISDLRMGENSGMDLLRLWKTRKPATPFIMMTAYGDVTSAVNAMKLGAADYLSKPVNPEELLLLIERCLEFRQKDETIRHLKERLDERLGFEKMVGSSKAMLDLFDQVRRAARSVCTVLITGESGTGKELIAEALHHHSMRSHGPFVTVNMAAVPEHLVESELFGHVKGAFTGAMGARIGRFEAADGGTLFIDEIGDFAQASQAKLLRVLENHKITPIGSNNDRQVVVRVVAATSRHLDQMVKEQRFREDLYYRLNVVTIHLPPLRNRPEDIPLLIAHFNKLLCALQNRSALQLDSELLDFLYKYEWPGNVRQLRNAMESMVVLARGECLTMDDLPRTIESEVIGESTLRITDGGMLRDLQRSAVEKALQEHVGNRTRAASALGISVRTLQRKLKSWGVENNDVANL